VRNENEAVRDLLSKLTEAPFRVTEPVLGDSLHGKKLKWFVACEEATYVPQTAHADTAWADVDDKKIWLESSIFGFASDFIEEDYGEEASIRFMRMKSHDFSDSLFRQEFWKEFPLVMKKFEDYELVASQISSRRDVQLQLKYHEDFGGEEVTLTLVAVIDITEGMDLQSRLKAIEKNVQALKEAYQEIENLRMPSQQQ